MWMLDKVRWYVTYDDVREYNYSMSVLWLRHGRLIDNIWILE